MDTSELAAASLRFLLQNYDYLWLKTMLEKGRTTTVSGSTLITGSSHALNAVWEPAWRNAVNCSMHSQDLYYDFCCARAVLAPSGGAYFERCLIVLGYYIAFQDLSRSKQTRQTMVSRIYYPLFRDARHWKEPTAADPWARVGMVPESVRPICEQAAREELLRDGTYYNDLRKRGSYYDLGGRTWAGLTEEERDTLGRHRAGEHNELYAYQASFAENCEILREYVRFLYTMNVLPIFVIPPFTKSYQRYVLPELKEAVTEMVDSVPEEVHYVDFNDTPELFSDEDFMDTDHLSLTGAKKVSELLAELFGR